MRIFLLDSGTMMIDRSQLLWNVDCGVRLRFPIYSVLVEHEDGLFLFDTGATRSMIATAYAATIGGASESSPAAVRTYGGNVAGAAALRNVSLRFGGVPLGTETVNRSDLTQRSRLGGVEIAGFLGLDALDGTVIRIDTTRQRVLVTPRARRAG